MSQLPEDPFSFVIDCYKKSGLRVSSAKFRKIISVYILLPLLLILYGMIIINLKYKSSNIFEFAEVFEAISTFGQCVVRKLIILIHGHLFEEVFKERSKFWKYDTFGKKQSQEFRKQMNFSVSLIKNLWFASVFSLIFHFCTPFFVKNAVLPDACWIPNNNGILTVLIYILEIVFYVEVIFLLGVFDAFFLCMCTDLKIQFQLLIATVRSVGLQINNGTIRNKNVLKKFKMCVVHHCFVLQVHQKLNRIFSEYFVCQFMINVGGVCIQFFIINDKSSNITQILRSIIYILVASLLGVLIFLPSSAIEEQAKQFQIEIYNINWQNKSNLNLRKFLIFWLKIAQNSLSMSAAGFFEVNRNVLIKIPRLAFSIATVLGSVD